ncbi:hypothetical protein [Spongiactinospora sp. TRM90649]|uniref:hypothetical protein n=1 Tax=Spongiactinospora sp. TRM90649 TaxID=3031114 RepID=UPI0023F9E68E|nr:hypothetical protein [Spongiactinospora sp. TRM90649]MDF5752745.1 hypothetical protein [Spongiactinospora sp. TRM90649]
MPDPDHALCARLRSGDLTALDALLARDHGVAGLLARVAGAGEPESVLETAWRRLVADIVAGEVTGGLRAALLGRTLAAIGPTGESAVPPDGRFLPPGDPWAGWWSGDGPAEWPPGFAPDDRTVAEALRRIPLPLRILLVARHVAGLSAEEAAALAGREPEHQEPLLRAAAEAYLAAIDAVVADGG